MKGYPSLNGGFELKKMKMMKLIFTGVFLLSFGLQGTSGQNADPVHQFVGSWIGTLKFKGMELRLVFNARLNEKDSLIVTIDSPDQGVKGITTSRSAIRADSAIIWSKVIMGSYRGAFNDDRKTMTGTWRQGGMNFPLEMKQQENEFVLNRPQEPQPPFPYISREVKFRNYADTIDLAGTLTIPDSVKTFPAVILITGSGAQNRNEEIFGHKPFAVIADHLSRNGFAVLRIDDRGVGGSGGKFSTSTTFDFVKDISSAVDFLKTQQGIDTSKIGLMGHSEGGLIAPILASERKDIAFIVLLAGPGIPGEKLIPLQTELISRINGVKEQDINESKKTDLKVFAILKKNSDNQKASEKIKALLVDLNKKESKKTGKDTMTEIQIDREVRNTVSPWFRTFLFLDPVTYLSKVKCPLLALNGELDLQVPPDENLHAIEKSMIFGGNSNYKIEMIPKLNHLFQTATTGSPAEYGKIEETFSPVALEMITTWLTGVIK